MKERLQDEIHDMSEKIFALQAKTEHLTNGQRYAAINEIEKSISTLRNDVHHLERKIYNQQHNTEELTKEIDRILQQIVDLENLKSDLIARINTETEHTRKYYHDEVMQFMRDEITPLRTTINNNEKEINNLKEYIKDEFTKMKFELLEEQQSRELKEAKKYDKLKWILTGVVSVITPLSVLSLYFEPAIQTFIHIFLGL